MKEIDSMGVRRCDFEDAKIWLERPILPPGVSWNVFILFELGVIFVDRFDFIGVTREHEF